MDGVSMIEKVGHKKRMQMMRREWIQEGKPKPPRDDDEEDFVIPTEDAVPADTSASNTEKQSSNVESRSETQQTGGALARNNHNPFGEEEPDEDELDALLAEDAINDSVPKSLFGGPVSLTTSTTAAPTRQDEFDDDEEAMAGMDW
jgi:replication fork protection complex subunit Csm3/Swi3